MADVSIGDLIDQRYRIDAVLGEGGFGVVYKATQVSTGQPVAVKFLLRERLEVAKDAGAEVARFEREMRLIGQLKHPNIVRLIDSGKASEGQLYIVLEFVEGKTLFDLVQDEGALPLHESARLMFQVLDALSAAHRQGVIHRDLKPQNIMLPSTGFSRNAMVLDFGVAGIAEQARDASYVSLTATDEVRGTPAYMAPEQLRNEKPTEQLDIYAWGLVFIELLTGKKAVEGANAFETALMQADVTPVHVPEAIDDPELRRIILRAVAKPLDQRYATAGEALQDLRAWQSAGQKPLGSGAYAPLAPPDEGSSERSFLVAVLVGLFVLLGVMGAVVFWWLSSQPVEQAESPPQCRDHSACDKGELCGPDNACHAWANETCQIIEGPLQHEHGIVVGAIGPIDHPSYVPREQAIRLATREFNEFGNLPGGRKLVLVSCNDSGQRELGLQAARHLVGELGAVAIVGPGFSGIFMDVVGQVTQPAGVFTISNSATSPSITDLDDNDLAWRTVPSDAHQSDALVQLVKDRGYERVVILAKADTYGAGLLDRVSSGLVPHLGKGLVARTYPTQSPDLENILPDALASKPQAILIFGTTEVVDILAMSEGLASRAGGALPTYILSEAGRRPEVISLAERMPALKGRVEAVGPQDRNDDIYENLIVRFEAAFGPVPEVSKIGNAYDAMVVVGFGIGAIPAEAQITGIAIANAVRMLISGEATRVGPSSIAPTLAKIHRGESVDLEGTSGPLDFDLNTGDVEAATLRWEVDGTPPSFVRKAVFQSSEEGTSTWSELGGQPPAPASPDVVQPVPDEAAPDGQASDDQVEDEHAD